MWVLHKTSVGIEIVSMEMKTAWLILKIAYNLVRLKRKAKGILAGSAEWRRSGMTEGSLE